MPHFRKKPVVIEAVLYRAGEQPGELVADVVAGTVHYNEDGTATIRTLEGDHLARPGDYIIRGVKGELYPCKPDIFEATYEPAHAPYCEIQYPHDVGSCSRVTHGGPVSAEAPAP